MAKDDDGEVMDEEGVPAEASHDNRAPDVIRVVPSQGQKDLVHRPLSILHRNLGLCGNRPLRSILK